MSDAWLIIGVFVFAFILWVSTGGPDKPISFAGPYITPITDVDDTQSGYGDQIDVPGRNGSDGERVWSVKSVLGRFENALNDGESVGVVSPSAGRVKITSGAGGPSGSTPSREYVALRAEVETDITGWSLRSAKSGETVIIPAGTIAPNQGGQPPLTNIVLAEDEEAIITTGSSPLGTSFRENKCVGYLGSDAFVPQLSSRSCPAPLDELGDSYTSSSASYDACRQIVSGFGRCETASAPREASAECRAFIQERLNYEGCIAWHFNDADFRGDTWRVYLNRSSDLWRSDNETILLLDREGKTVDVYTY